jgi:hypothetical protein
MDLETDPELYNLLVNNPDVPEGAIKSLSSSVLSF